MQWTGDSNIDDKELTQISGWLIFTSKGKNHLCFSPSELKVLGAAMDLIGANAGNSLFRQERRPRPSGSAICLEKSIPTTNSSIRWREGLNWLTHAREGSLLPRLLLHRFLE